ncbi:hypothetical protein [Cellulomonas sp. URHE0023]|uniref:hypothetical protein n=1 Tax=Cellulomonas sp. URHE0023 TaxID=1380354 RepID=UPI00048686FF|nr:hypothetical protein [Cellulomonas sp. URHE0023]
MSDDPTQPHDDDAEGMAQDTAFARLQAADPARGTTADLTSVYQAVSAATGVAVTEETIPVDELSARRARRAPRWLQAAAVVAGIAVIGGGSYALGGANAEPAQLAEPAINLSNGNGNGSGSSQAGPALAPEAARDMASGADSKLAGWGFGRTVFASEGLSTDGGSAPAYGFDAAATFSQATIERVAAALGVTGTPQQQYGQWTVGPNDGSGATVSISPDGLTSISYYDPARDPWTCLKYEIQPVEPPTGADPAQSTEGSAQTEPFAPDPAPDTCQTSTDPAPTGDAAVALAKDTMSALGVDPAGFELEASTEPSGPQLTTVSAYQVVDGQRSGLSWSFSVVATGVQSVYGALAPTVPLGDYDVVSPSEAAARLSDPRFGPSYGGVMPMSMADGTARADVEGMTADVAPAPSDAPTVPATPSAGSPLAWPVQHVTLVSSRLGLALTTLPGGASVLAPTYELTDADGSIWTVIAVADHDLDFSA